MSVKGNLSLPFTTSLVKRCWIHVVLLKQHIQMGRTDREPQGAIFLQDRNCVTDHKEVGMGKMVSNFSLEEQISHTTELSYYRMLPWLQQTILTRNKVNETTRTNCSYRVLYNPLRRSNSSMAYVSKRIQNLFSMEQTKVLIKSVCCGGVDVEKAARR